MKLKQHSQDQGEPADDAGPPLWPQNGRLTLIVKILIDYSKSEKKENPLSDISNNQEIVANKRKSMN